ncbi:membrane integrity-associated transporter subunit PqiC [Pseudomonas sp. N040]|nr:membrane integrity-associated transporter subunit PqiC [Pseudomonas sp. N040]MBW7012447.1 ABC-type transport auxiliary lipoprotein family protein [Pseudomonas sp. N040]
MSSVLRQLAAIGALSLLGACSILPKSQPVQVYLLPAQLTAASKAPAVSWSLRLNTPQASQALNSSRIAVLPQGNQFSTYAASSWSDPAPRLLRNHLLNAFQADGRVRALSTDDDNLQADLQLGGELQAFQSEYHEGSVSVVLRLQARLVDNQRRILASQRFEVIQPVSGDAVPAVVSAFGQASDRLAAQLLQWTLAQGAAQPKNQ